MKTFKDLKFETHHSSKSGISKFSESKQATMDFNNGYGVSVLVGSAFYSNGIDSYELAITLNGDLCYTSGISDNVMAYISKEEVTRVMIEVQKLPTI